MAKRNDLTTAADTPAVDPGGDSGIATGEGSPEGTPTAAANTPESQGSSPEAEPGPAPSGDYLQRIASEPEFAKEQVRQKDARITELSQAAAKLKGLEDVVAQMGSAEAVMNSLFQYNAIMGSDSGLREAANDFITTGNKFNPTGSPEGEFSAGEEDAYADPKVVALEKQLSEVNARLNVTEGNAGVARMKSMLVEVKDKYGFAWADTVEPAIMSTVTAWQATADGRKMLGQVSAADFDTIAIRAIGLDGFRAEAASKYASELETARSKGTDAPSANLSSGKAVHPNKGHQSVLESIRIARAEIAAGTPG